MRVELRPLRPEDIPFVIAEPVPCRLRGITAVAQGRVLGIGALAFKPEGVFAFAQILPEGRKYPVAVHRAGLALMRLIHESGVARVIAEADEAIAAAPGWLERLGFKKIESPQGVAFVWERRTDAS